MAHHKLFGAFLSSAFLTTSAVLMISVFVLTIIYRFYFHPLAKIPGYKLAIASRLYEYHYDSTLHGRYWQKLQEMHDKLGPVIRINPREVHVNDPDFAAKIYNFENSWDRDPIMTRELAFHKTFNTTVSFAEHKRRRTPYESFFSRLCITGAEPLVRAVAGEMCAAIEKQASMNNGIAQMHLFYRAATAEAICRYCFGESCNLLQDLRKAESLCVNMPRPGDLPCVYHMGRFSPLLFNLISAFQMMGYLISKGLGVTGNLGAFEFFDYVTEMIDGAKRATATKSTFTSPDGAQPAEPAKTVFHDLLRSDAAREIDKEAGMMWENAVVFLNAGFETTGFTLTMGTYFVLNDPPVHERLLDELKSVMPETTSQPPSWAVLENLPYLHAVILESLRLSCGILSRVPRINRKNSVTIGKYTIPPGTPISMSQPLVHYNPTIFSDPLSFKPDRWLTGSKDDVKQLEKYLIPFSRGSRVCIGQHLAMAEMHYFIAAFTRRFEHARTVDAEPEDVLPYHDEFIPKPKIGKQKLEVRIQP